MGEREQQTDTEGEGGEGLASLGEIRWESLMSGRWETGGGASISTVE